MDGKFGAFYDLPYPYIVPYDQELLSILRFVETMGGRSVAGGKPKAVPQDGSGSKRRREEEDGKGQEGGSGGGKGGSGGGKGGGGRGGGGGGNGGGGKGGGGKGGGGNGGDGGKDGGDKGGDGGKKGGGKESDDDNMGDPSQRSKCTVADCSHISKCNIGIVALFISGFGDCNRATMVKNIAKVIGLTLGDNVEHGCYASRVAVICPVTATGQRAFGMTKEQTAKLFHLASELLRHFAEYSKDTPYDEDDRMQTMKRLVGFIAKSGYKAPLAISNHREALWECIDSLHRVWSGANVAFDLMYGWEGFRQYNEAPPSVMVLGDGNSFSASTFDTSKETVFFKELLISVAVVYSAGFLNGNGPVAVHNIWSFMNVLDKLALELFSEDDWTDYCNGVLESFIAKAGKNSALQRQAVFDCRDTAAKYFEIMKMIMFLTKKHALPKQREGFMGSNGDQNLLDCVGSIIHRYDFILGDKDYENLDSFDHVFDWFRLDNMSREFGIDCDSALKELEEIRVKQGSTGAVFV